jgi:hypothetical protein
MIVGIAERSTQLQVTYRRAHDFSDLADLLQQGTKVRNKPDADPQMRSRGRSREPPRAGKGLSVSEPSLEASCSDMGHLSAWAPHSPEPTRSRAGQQQGGAKGRRHMLPRNKSEPNLSARATSALDSPVRQHSGGSRQGMGVKGTSDADSQKRSRGRSREPPPNLTASAAAMSARESPMQRRHNAGSRSRGRSREPPRAGKGLSVSEPNLEASRSDMGHLSAWAPRSPEPTRSRAGQQQPGAAGGLCQMLTAVSEPTLILHRNEALHESLYKRCSPPKSSGE